MSPATESQDRLRDQANDLYWNSSDTVDQLASRLGMGRKAVYAAVRPLPLGLECEACGAEMVFTNRTSRATGAASCPSCGAQASVEEEAPPPTPTDGAELLENGAVSPEPVTVPPAGGRWRLRDVAPDRAAKIGGAAALGVALGAAAVTVIRKRS